MHACVAKVGTAMPRWAPRKGERCGSASIRYRDLLVDGELIVVPLCRLHFRRVLESRDPVALVRSWGPEFGESAARPDVSSPAA
jgi:hypothetical protein